MAEEFAKEGADMMVTFHRDEDGASRDSPVRASSG
jgi:hypothetical protein